VNLTKKITHPTRCGQNKITLATRVPLVRGGWKFPPTSRRSRTSLNGESLSSRRSRTSLNGERCIFTPPPRFGQQKITHPTRFGQQKITLAIGVVRGAGKFPLTSHRSRTSLNGEFCYFSAQNLNKKILEFFYSNFERKNSRTHHSRTSLNGERWGEISLHLSPLKFWIHSFLAVLNNLYHSFLAVLNNL